MSTQQVNRVNDGQTFGNMLKDDPIEVDFDQMTSRKSIRTMQKNQRSNQGKDSEKSYKPVQVDFD